VLLHALEVLAIAEVNGPMLFMWWRRRRAIRDGLDVIPTIVSETCGADRINTAITIKSAIKLAKTSYILDCKIMACVFAIMRTSEQVMSKGQ